MEDHTQYNLLDPLKPTPINSPGIYDAPNILALQKVFSVGAGSKTTLIDPNAGIRSGTLSTIMTAPATTGTTYTVITDSNGQLSYTTSASTFPYGTSTYRNSSAQTINASSATKVQLNGELWDFSSEYDPVTNFRYTAITAGYYLINFSAYFATAEDAKFYNAYVFKNNNTTVVQATVHSGSTSELSVGGSMIALLAANDFLELYVFHNSAASKDLTAGQGVTYMNIQRIK